MRVLLCAACLTGVPAGILADNAKDDNGCAQDDSALFTLPGDTTSTGDTTKAADYSGIRDNPAPDDPRSAVGLSTPADDPAIQGEAAAGDLGPVADPCRGAPGRHRPVSLLSRLGNNTAVSLGDFACNGPDTICQKVTDFSGLTYDPVNHQLLMFGGGHSSTMTDAVFAMKIAGLPVWTQLYEPTPCRMMTADNLDASLGAWLSGNGGPYPRPLAAHTYDFVTFDPARNELVLLGRLFTKGQCSAVGNAVKGPVAHYSLSTNQWSFSNDGAWAALQGGIPGGEFDPVTGSFITLGSGGLHVYDPSTRTIKGVNTRFPNPPGYANHLTYSAVDDTFYYFIRGASVQTYALVLNRKNLSASTLEIVDTTGPTSRHFEPGYAYDSINRVLGGGVHDNRFFIFDPIARTWSAHAIEGGQPGTMAFHTIAYDPVNNVFLFITNDRKTWAYRYRES